MGTRADYYVGRGEHAEWLGSTAWDGYPSGLDDTGMFEATTEDEYRAVIAEIAKRDDFTSPDEVWPWPWDTSHTTDYAYAFDGDHVWISCFGHDWHSRADEDVDDDEDQEYVEPENRPTVFPNMKHRANVQFGGKKSGLMVFSFPA